MFESIETYFPERNRTPEFTLLRFRDKQMNRVSQILLMEISNDEKIRFINEEMDKDYLSWVESNSL